MSVFYKIYRLSARTVLGYAKPEDDDRYSFRLSKTATRKCILPNSEAQEDNALFYQIMCVLHGGRFPEIEKQSILPDLCETIFIMDFVLSTIVVYGFRTATEKINKEEKTDNTEQITKMVRELLTKKSIFHRRFIKPCYIEKSLLYTSDEYNYFDLVREKWYTTNTSEKDYVIKDSLVATDINEYNNNYQYLYKKNKTKIIKYC